MKYESPQREDLEPVTDIIPLAFAAITMPLLVFLSSLVLCFHPNAIECSFNHILASVT